MFLHTFKWRKKIFLLLLISVILFDRRSAADDEDYEDEEEENLIARDLNCFSLIDESAWHRVLTLDRQTGILRVNLNNTDARVISCLQDQVSHRPNGHYLISLWRKQHRDLKFEEKSILIQDWISSIGGFKHDSSETVTDQHDEVIQPKPDVAFSYVLLEGQYRVRFQFCEPFSSNKSTPESSLPNSEEELVCDSDNEMTSDVIFVDEPSGLVDTASWCFGSNPDAHPVRSEPPVVDLVPSLTFRFQFSPCFDEALHREQVVVTLHSLPEDSVRHGNLTACFDETRGAHIFLRTTVNIERQFDADTSTQLSVISFKTPSLPGDHYYCLSVSSDHLMCRDIEYFGQHNNANSNSSEDETGGPVRHGHHRTILRRPKFCHFHSEVVHVPSRPWIGQLIPLCTSHFACGWIYVVAACMAILLVSCLLAIVCVYCCCKNEPRHFKTHHHHIPTEDQHTFDTLCLADIKPKKTWVEVHEDFYREPPKNPGKILLLYSPDSKLFKDLQQSFRSFLELACHCVVLDLFDEELFQSIAYDPEAWLFNLLQDDKFKIVIICSENAFKRQQALLKGEVLNIPDVNSSLDGLFTAGLKFIQEQHAYDYHRLALVRYEMLALTSPEFKLQDMVPNREFLVPTQLHDLFCWIHDHDPLDLLGKPWDRYHLELQLLQDALKQARLDRRY